MIMPPVGKSGPGTMRISSSSEVSGSAISASVASMISLGLCGRDVGRHADGDAVARR